MEEMNSFTSEMKANENLLFCVQLFIFFSAGISDEGRW